MADKHGTPIFVERDPAQPLPGEWPRRKQRIFRRIVLAVLLLGAGAILGFVLTPESPRETRARIAALQAQLDSARGRIAELERGIQYKAVDKPAALNGKLKREDRERHEREGRRISKLLRKAKAQSAAELMSWFVTRWNALLDQPEANDRIGRRASLLSLLIGGMAENLDPNDYVPWQAEFLNGNWLGELHFDLDGDGMPAKRTMPNPRDGFADASVCLIAMALNQAARDARVLVMPNMQCDRPEAKMSVFLQGTTLNDALDSFVTALRNQGFLVVERVDRGVRLLLVGQRGRQTED